MKQKLIYILWYRQEIMTLSINCKDAGDPVCTHTMYGETEEELLKNAKEHGIKEHGYTEESWNEKMSKDQKVQDINKIIIELFTFQKSKGLKGPATTGQQAVYLTFRVRLDLQNIIQI